MYIPSPFDASDPGRCHALIRQESFASLVTVDAAGIPFATHLPFLLDAARGALGTLIAHMARANPQWRHFAASRPVLVIFQGAHAYVSPAWYEARESVPTWNYVAVHAYGVPGIVEDPARVEAVLGTLVRTYEADRPQPWRMESLSPEYVARMIRGIVAFEIPIDRLEGKAKLSQNRGVADRTRVRAALAAASDPLSRAVAEQMAEVEAPEPGATR